MSKLHRTLFLLATIVSTVALRGTAQQARPQGPSDIYAAARTPCVTAHSTVRSLSSRYGGPLYEVKRAGGWQRHHAHGARSPAPITGARR